MSRPITLKQLNGLTLSDMFSSLVGLDVPHPTGVLGVLCLISGSGKCCYVFFVVFCFFTFLSKRVIYHQNVQLLLQSQFILQTL